MSDRASLPGKFVWFDHVSKDPKRAQAFYGEVLGWSVRPFQMGPNFTYDMIYLGENMIGGYGAPKDDGPARWESCVSVEDVDAAARAATAQGGRVLEAPASLEGVGRLAKIADPQGAALWIIENSNGDPPDGPAPHGGFLWDELHTPDPKAALAFYEKVVGFTHRSQEMGPGGTYHIIGRGGTDRGGVTHHLRPGQRPHWLPYICVDDADATLARARKHGATVEFGPEDIPGAGRSGVISDPTGAFVAFLKPIPPGR
jgi:uncharacterized protein